MIGPARTIAPHVLPRERLDALSAVCASLRTDSQTLIESLRGHLTTLRHQREQLNRQRDSSIRGAGPSNGASASIAARYRLTAREAEVAVLLTAGRGNAAIAAALRISPHTARHHTQRVLAKLGVHSRAEAGARLRENGFR